MKSISERLKFIRKDNGLKKQDMARILKVEVDEYSKIESGKVDLTTMHLKKIAENFNVSLDWLIAGKLVANFGGNDLREFGNHADGVGRMIYEMRKNKALMHSILSHYYQHKEIEKFRSIIKEE